jgi:hypothetical protein
VAVGAAGVAVAVAADVLVSSTRLSKLVSQPLVLAIVTLAQGPVQPVLMVVCWPAARVVCRVGCPAQLRVMLVLAPPL